MHLPPEYTCGSVKHGKILLDPTHCISGSGLAKNTG